MAVSSCAWCAGQVREFGDTLVGNGLCAQRGDRDGHILQPLFALLCGDDNFFKAARIFFSGCRILSKSRAGEKCEAGTC